MKVQVSYGHTCIVSKVVMTIQMKLKKEIETNNKQMDYSTSMLSWLFIINSSAEFVVCKAWNFSPAWHQKH